MRRSDRPRLPAELLLPEILAFLIAGPLALQAQGTTQSASSASPPFRSLADLRAHVTPEDVGDSLLVRHRYQEAIEQYRKASSDSSDVWDKMGIAYQMLSDLKDAGRCYKQSLRLKPANELAINNLATVFELQGQYGKAEGMYRRALILDPTSPKIAMNLGTVLMIQSKYDQGSDLYKRALALDPQVFEHSVGPVYQSGIPLEQRGAINFYKARHCAQAGMVDRAVKYLQKAINEGFTTPGKIARDSSFAALHGIPAYEHLIAEHGD